jgi:3-deoxy-7-phosphoheptulonate synthase
VVPILKEYKLASRDVRPEPSIIEVNGVKFGGKKIPVIAGPCSVEGKDQVVGIAREVKRSGASLLRGGAFKPRTSPYTFQGMAEEGLKLLDEARKVTGLSIVTEVMDSKDVELVERYSDIVQIGTRNAQNFSLLKEVGQCKKPVLLKRGLSMTVKEFLMAAEYILSHGNKNVILCERGIRTFENATRNTLDLSAIPVLKEQTHLPVIVDPSHGTGYWQYVSPMAKAAVAAGADGLMIEVHNCPEEALSDGPQSLKPKKFDILMTELRPFAEAAGREL